MTLSTTEIALVVARWNRELVGSFLRKALSPSAPDRIALELYGDTFTGFVEICLAPKFCRLNRIVGKPEAAETPHPFVMLLRREAVGARLLGVRQLGGDRVVALDFGARELRGTLLCELTGRHGNLFWLGADGAIVGSFHTNRSHLRPLVPGQAYVPPLPKKEEASTPSRFVDGENLESTIAVHYSAAEAAGALEEERVALQKAVRKELARRKKLEGNLAADREKAAKAAAMQRMAHVLKANLRRIPRGSAKVDLLDFEGAPLSIPLDPSRDATANMERLYDKAKRLLRAAPRIEERAAENARAVQALEGFAARLANAPAEELASIRTELAPSLPLLPKSPGGRRRAVPERVPFHEIAIAAGRTARVGRSAADNDTLTLRHARPEDLWLHVRGEAGSHVVVPLGRGEEPTEEMLVDAAHLAAFFSQAKERDDVEVTYTRRKYVQKPRGFPPGAVRLLREKTILLRVEKERLARLLGREG